MTLARAGGEGSGGQHLAGHGVHHLAGMAPSPRRQPRPLTKRLALSSFVGMPLGLVDTQRRQRPDVEASRSGIAVLIATALAGAAGSTSPTSARASTSVPGSCPACSTPRCPPTAHRWCSTCRRGTFAARRVPRHHHRGLRARQRRRPLAVPGDGKVTRDGLHAALDRLPAWVIGQGLGLAGAQARARRALPMDGADAAVRRRHQRDRVRAHVNAATSCGSVTVGTCHSLATQSWCCSTR
jgi:hypothetical protein